MLSSAEFWRKDYEWIRQHIGREMRPKWAVDRQPSHPKLLNDKSARAGERLTVRQVGCCDRVGRGRRCARRGHSHGSSSLDHSDSGFNLPSGGIGDCPTHTRRDINRRASRNGR